MKYRASRSGPDSRAGKAALQRYLETPIRMKLVRLHERLRICPDLLWPGFAVPVPTKQCESLLEGLAEFIPGEEDLENPHCRFWFNLVFDVIHETYRGLATATSNRDRLLIWLHAGLRFREFLQKDLGEMSKWRSRIPPLTRKLWHPNARNVYPSAVELDALLTGWWIEGKPPRFSHFLDMLAKQATDFFSTHTICHFDDNALFKRAAKQRAELNGEHPVAVASTPPQIYRMPWDTNR